MIEHYIGQQNILKSFEPNVSTGTVGVSAPGAKRKQAQFLETLIACRVSRILG